VDPRRLPRRRFEKDPRRSERSSTIRISERLSSTSDPSPSSDNFARTARRTEVESPLPPRGEEAGEGSVTVLASWIEGICSANAEDSAHGVAARLSPASSGSLKNCTLHQRHLRSEKFVVTSSNLGRCLFTVAFPSSSRDYTRCALRYVSECYCAAVTPDRRSIPLREILSSLRECTALTRTCPVGAQEKVDATDLRGNPPRASFCPLRNGQEGSTRAGRVTRANRPIWRLAGFIREMRTDFNVPCKGLARRDKRAARLVSTE